jgi:hypothetical protein
VCFNEYVDECVDERLCVSVCKSVVCVCMCVYVCVCVCMYVCMCVCMVMWCVLHTPDIARFLLSILQGDAKSTSSKTTKTKGPPPKVRVLEAGE